MFIPSAKSKLSLIILLLIAIFLFIWSYNSRMFVKEDHYDEKLAAAKLMSKAEQAIKDHRKNQNIFVDKVNDPNETMLIGEKQTQITTDRGDLEVKLTTLNPNFAAVIIDLFKKAKLKSGDEVAVSLTGSMPALNIAVLSAAKILDLKLIIISSVGASMFGATDPNFTWLDMESYLQKKNILPYKSVAASIGGGKDIGRGLSKNGRDLIIEAINRNNVPLVKEKSLIDNIQKKMEIFRHKSNEKIKLYINIGGGLSSIGSSLSGRLVKSGLRKFISSQDIPVKGTMFLFAEDKIPVIHLEDIKEIAKQYDLPIAPEPLPEPGTGKVFVEEIYNINVAIISLIIMIILIVIIIFFDYKEQRFKKDELGDENIL